MDPASWAYLDIELKSEELGFVFVFSADIGASRSRVPKIWTHGPGSVSERMNLIKGWLEYCETNHLDCRPQTAVIPAMLPKRLLRVTDGLRVRLVDSREEAMREKKLRYATLSHCWGKSLPLRAMRNNIDEFSKHISYHIIPQTFKDAIKICRFVGIEFLWVDALCIVQDDQDEWEDEAYIMKDIYSGSSLTIAASDGFDSYSGCVQRHSTAQETQDRPPSHLTHAGSMPVLQLPADPGFTFIYKEFSSSYTIQTTIRISPRSLPWPAEDSPLGSRGWVFQEQLLSPRTVYCIHNGFQWQCKSSYKLEIGRETGRNEFLFADSDSLWSNWMTTYSKRKFTYLSDRLPALAGAISLYMERTGHTPMLGLWKESFAHDLGWRREFRQAKVRCPGYPPYATKAKETIQGHSALPSWTWLSIYGPCIPFSPERGEEWEFIHYHLSLSSFSITWTGNPFTSSLLSATLEVKGCIRDMSLSVAPETKDKDPVALIVDDDALHSYQPPYEYQAFGQFDHDEYILRRHAIYPCLFLMSAGSRSGEREDRRLIFLILEEVKMNGVKGYKRVGIGALHYGKDEKPRFSLEELELSNIRFF